MESILRYSFVPKFQIIGGKFNKTFALNSGYGLQLGIMSEVTNDLGYNKIRNSRKTNITNDELYSHLEKMDKRTQAIKDKVSKSFTSGLIYLWDEERNYLNTTYKKLEGIRDKMYERNLNDEFTILEYKSQIKQKDAEIKRLKEKNQRNLLSRIFNLHVLD
jgi:hypothetical protein